MIFNQLVQNFWRCLLPIGAMACCLPAFAQQPSFDQLVVFGDSISDVGNGSIIWGPQGALSANPVNDYSNGRYTDGPDTTPATSQPALIWTDRLASKLGLSAPTPSLAGGTDFAVAGATVIGGSSQYPSLDMQVQQAIAKGVSPNSLYAFSGGGNDVMNQTTPSAAVPAAISAAQEIGQEISSLAAKGARYFVWVSLPAFERIPDIASSSDLSQAFGAASIAYNQQQAAIVSQLRNQLTSQGVVIATVDIYGLFTNILNDPSPYGFTNTTVSAAGLPVNPDTYVFWKSGHFTTTSQALIGDEIARVVSRVFSGGSRFDAMNTSTGNGRLDFDGDRRSDFLIWRPQTAQFFTIMSGNPSRQSQQGWGTSTDVPVPGDYDGDGITDVAVWRPSTGQWFIIPSSHPDASYSQGWGNLGDIPVPGDYDGDGKTDIAIWRPSNSVWYALPSGSPGTSYIKPWGLSGDIPVPGDYDGDGRADFAVWRPSDGIWYISQSSAGTKELQWGMAGDIPVPGDYDGDGKTDIAVRRPSEGWWFFIPSSTGVPSVMGWGNAGDLPEAADYDGDGKTDLAVWRPSTGTWWVLPSSNPSGFIAQVWGAHGDSPF